MSSTARMLVLAGAGVLVALATLGALIGDRATDDGFEATDLVQDLEQAPVTPADEEAPEGAPSDSEPPVDDAEAPPTPQLHAEYFADRDPGDPRALGDPDAPIVMIEWGDFLCGFCARYARETAPELIERYVDTGVLRIEWRDLPLQGDDAWTAALAGRAAADQDAFWDLHEILYADQPADRPVRLTRAGLREVAADLDLDIVEFESSLDDPDNATSVATERQTAQALGIQGTPAFLIHEQPVMGAQPLQVFVDVIEAAAADLGVDLPER